MSQLKRWYDTEEEAIRVARGSGYYCWRVQKTGRVRHGTKWSYERYLIGPPRWYVGFKVPKYCQQWKCEEIEKAQEGYPAW